MRGLAVLVMIECHTFNSFARLDVRNGGPYVLSQFVGGMAAPLFLFMAGMTFGFQMESLERRDPNRWRRWLVALRRAGYIMAITEITKVDILNSMALAMGAFAVAAAFDGKNRVRFALGGALAVAAIAPVIESLSWSGTPQLILEYLAPGPNRGRFPFFPCAAYVGFGLAAGAIVRRTAERTSERGAAEPMDRLMQWCALIGFAAIFTAQYFANIPFSIYPTPDFWRSSPALVFIRTGISLAMLASAYLWTEYGAAARWSWMQALGQTSLLVYWVHVMLVYGNIVKHWKRALSIPQTALAFTVVTALMVALAAARLAWKHRKKHLAYAPAPGTLVTRTN